MENAVYDHTTRRLHLGEHVLFHTDGLYRRGQTGDDWIAGLSDRLRETDGDAQVLLDSLEFGASGDDACVLMAQRLR